MKNDFRLMITSNPSAVLMDAGALSNLSEIGQKTTPTNKVFIAGDVHEVITPHLLTIRNQLCHAKKDITLVGYDSGFSHGEQGYLAYGMEDIAMLRSLPNMQIYSPADIHELEYCLRMIMQRGGPSYLRLTGEAEPALHAVPIPFAEPALLELKPVKPLTFFATGVALQEAIKALEMLAAEGIEAGLYSVPFIHSLLENDFIDLLRQCKCVVSAEEHHVKSGMGSMICEISTEYSPGTHIYHRGLHHKYLKESGVRSVMRQRNGIDAASLVADAKRSMQLQGLV